MSDEQGQQSAQKKVKPVKAKPGNPRINELGKATQFKKGQAPPKGVGRPRKLPSLDLALSKMLNQKKQGVNGIEAIVMAMRNKAIAGDTKAAQLLLDRGYGKVKQDVDITSGGEPLTKDKTAVVTLPDGTILEI